MTTTMEAIYENGTLKLPRPLPLEEKAQVVVTIQTEADGDGAKERQAWLKRSEEVLTKAWDNRADDVFNELPLKPWLARDLLDDCRERAGSSPLSEEALDRLSKAQSNASQSPSHWAER